MLYSRVAQLLRRRHVRLVYTQSYNIHCFCHPQCFDALGLVAGRAQTALLQQFLKDHFGGHDITCSN